MKSFQHAIKRRFSTFMDSFEHSILDHCMGNVSYAYTKFPPLTGYINDIAHLLDHATKINLTEKLATLEEKQEIKLFL